MPSGSTYEEAERYAELTAPAIDPLRHRVLVVLSLCGRVAGRAVIDVGCGPGMFLEHLDGQRPHRLVGCDMSTDMLDLAKVRVPNAEVVQIDITTTALPTSQFDCALCVMVLHTVASLDDCVQHIANGLATEGLLVIGVPHPCFHYSQDQIDAWSGGPYHAPLNGPAYHSERCLKNRFGNPPFEVAMIHRPIARYVEAVLAAGLTIVSLQEPGPFELSPWAHVPAFLLLAASKS
jgi:SAM-dependent methyltransferase